MKFFKKKLHEFNTRIVSVIIYTYKKKKSYKLHFKIKFLKKF